MEKYQLSDLLPYMVPVKQTKDGYCGTCPVCSKKEHLYAKEKSGKLLLYCQKCNAAFGDIIKAFDAKGASKTAADKNALDNKPIIEKKTYCYKNPDGSIAYQKHRKKYADGSKQFYFSYLDNNNKQIWKKPNNCNNLYNLNLLESHKDTEVLYIVEGEKCADAMTRAGLLATTSNTGSQSNVTFSSVDKVLLNKYKNQVIIPDNDEAGKKYIAAYPKAKVLDLRTIWPACPSKGDVADYFAAGGDVEKIKNYIFGDALDKTYFDRIDSAALISDELLSAIRRLEPGKKDKAEILAVMAAKRLGVPTRQYNQLLRANNNDNNNKSRSGGGQAPASAGYTAFPQQPLKLRCGNWSCQSNVTDPTKGEASPVPLMPVAILRNLEDKSEKIKISYYDAVRGWVPIIAARSVVANKLKIISLADRGLPVNSLNAGLMVGYIADMVDNNADLLPYVNSVSHLGWVGNDFAPYDHVAIDCEGADELVIKSVAAQGSVDDWVSCIRPHWLKHIEVRLAIASAVASILIDRLKVLPFVVHFWGASGHGKTLMLQIVASVWGSKNLIRTMNDTCNSLLATAGLLHDIPLMADELQAKAANYFGNYDDFVMQFCEGRERGRLDRAAKIKSVKSWSSIAITTGEEPLTKYNSGGGAKNRCLDIECGNKIFELSEAQKIAQVINKNYGLVGKKIVEFVKDKDVISDYNTICRIVADIGETTDKQAMAVSVLLLADSYVCEAVIGTNNVLNPQNVVKKIVKSYKDVDVATRAYESVCSVIAANRYCFYRGNEYPNQNKEVWGSLDNNIAVISKEILQREMRKLGYDFDALKKSWALMSVLIVNSEGKYAYNTSVHGIKTKYVKLIIND